MSSSIVREAFETSVTCSPQSFQRSHESIVPKARSPAAPAFASSHSSFVAEKYGSGIEAGALADQLHRQLGAACGRPPVLPDDRAPDRLTASLVPDERRLALVRDPDRVELTGPHARVVQRRRRRVDHRLPDLVGVVLHEPGRREVLAELLVAASERLQRVVQDEAGGAGRPLVDRKEHG